MRCNSVFASTMLQHYNLFCADNSWHATELQYNDTVRLRHGMLINMTLPFPCTRRIMIRTGMRSNIKLIRKHPKIRRILLCESPYFHHCTAHVNTCSSARRHPTITSTLWWLCHCMVRDYLFIRWQHLLISQLSIISNGRSPIHRLKMRLVACS